jgi:Tol biopolymer transport system component
MGLLSGQRAGPRKACFAVLALLGACSSDTALTTPSVTSPTDSLAKPANFPSLVGRIAFVSTRDGSPYIYVAAADGSSLRRLTKGQDPDWSSDGQQIVFNGADSVGDLSVHVINADGTGERVLRVSGSTPHLSPDGRRISFTTALGVYVANIDGSDPTRLVPSDFQGSKFSFTDGVWSPDGTRIALLALDNLDDRWSDDGSWSQPAVYVAKADGSGIELTAQPGDVPRWSPDGSTIAYAYAAREVGIASADGSGGRTVTTSIDFPETPDWSPDGRILSFTGGTAASAKNGANGTRIFATDPVLHATIQLIPNAISPARLPYDDSQAVWSRAMQP